MGTCENDLITPNEDGEIDTRDAAKRYIDEGLKVIPVPRNPKGRSYQIGSYLRSERKTYPSISTPTAT